MKPAPGRDDAKVRFGGSGWRSPGCHSRHDPGAGCGSAVGEGREPVVGTVEGVLVERAGGVLPDGVEAPVVGRVPTDDAYRATHSGAVLEKSPLTQLLHQLVDV